MPRQGLSICAHRGSSVLFPRHEWSDVTVADWARRCAARPRWRRSFIGGWHDPRSGHVWLDLVHVVSPRLRPGACLIGRALRQRSLFDIGRGELVMLGSGER